MNLKEWLLAIAIIILTIFVTFYGINSLFPKPQYEDFCEDNYYKFAEPVKIDPNEICPTVCIEMYEISGKECVLNTCGSGCGPDNINSFERQEDCEQVLSGKYCYDDLEDAQRIRSKYVFFVALPLALIIIAIGAFAFGLEVVGVGLMGGGIATLIYGAGAFWPYTENWVRFIMSLIGLILLIWLIYYFNRKKSKRK